MKANERFLKQDKSFWANVRTISELVGYTRRGAKRGEAGQVKVPTFPEVKKAFQKIGLGSDHIIGEAEHLNSFGKLLFDYFEYRADILNNFVESRLMDVNRAKALYETLREQLNPRCHLPDNKQSGEKKSKAYFTCIINMLIEANAEGYPYTDDPRKLTAIIRNDAPLRTLARRLDGAFTSTVNPIAAWEIKEYYYTKTFGSRVSDGVYETLLDGMEFEELREHENIAVKHYLMLDDHFTWWVKGRSYLCRIIDMLHMGYVDEVLFGYEVIERLPSLVKEWVEIARSRSDLYKYRDDAMIVRENEGEALVEGTEHKPVQRFLL
jgi:hypothetical protein